MTQRYLSLVLVEVPDHIEGTKYAQWFNMVSIEHIKLFNGLLEIIFSDGTIKKFNQEESKEILIEGNELIHKAIWGKSYDVNAHFENLINED